MAPSFESNIQQILGQLVYQLTAANTQVAQLGEQVKQLEAQLLAIKQG